MVGSKSKRENVGMRLLTGGLFTIGLLGILFANTSQVAIAQSSTGLAPATKQRCNELLARPCKKSVNPKSAAQYSRYFQDTMRSIDQMRGNSGLVADKVAVLRDGEGKIHTKTLNSSTSLTGIALDLILQAELATSPLNGKPARRKMQQVLSVLEGLLYHASTGLFFTWYSTQGVAKPTDWNVSSIDNLHLAIALFTIKEQFKDTPMGRTAKRLLDRMNFSVFLEPGSGLVGGNLRYQNYGSWAKESYNLSDLGSEGRSLYAIGWALNLFRDYKMDETFLLRALSSLTGSVYRSKQGSILRLWDGGGFQLLLPQLLIDEAQYSPVLQDMFKSYASYIIVEGARQGYPLPAGHSASNYGVDRDLRFKNVPAYNGKSGSPALVSLNNRDILDPHLRELWDSMVTPHVLIMAAASDAERFAPILAQAESLGSVKTRLYVPKMGWMDGYHVKGQYRGQVVPVQLSLDQGMIALALVQIQADDGMTSSARALYDNPQTRSRLELFYRLLDNKLQSLMNEGNGKRLLQQPAFKK